MWNREKTSERNLFDRPLADLKVPEQRPPERAVPPPVSEPALPEAAAVVPPKSEVPSRKPAASAPTPAPAKGSVLGATLRFKGDLVADEDLVVQGQIEGSILHTRSLTIGTDGAMKGDIRARRITVEGKVTGDLYALECVTVRETGSVTGSIFAPRVAIAEGAKFNGRVDMANAPTVPHAAPAGIPAAPGARPGAASATEVALDESAVKDVLEGDRAPE